MTIQQVYDFMAGRDISTSFSDPAHNSAIDFSEFVAADKEAKRVKAELSAKKDGTYLLEAAIPAVIEYDEEGNETVISEAVDAVYYEYTNDSDLIDSVISDLDVEALLGEL